jgi:hypothetical protein
MNNSTKEKLDRLLNRKANKVAIKKQKAKAKTIAEKLIRGTWSKEEKTEAMVLLRDKDMNVYQTAIELSKRWEKNISRQTIMNWRDKIFDETIIRFDLAVAADKRLKPEELIKIDDDMKARKREIDNLQITASELLVQEMIRMIQENAQANRLTFKDMAYCQDIFNKSFMATQARLNDGSGDSESTTEAIKAKQIFIQNMNSIVMSSKNIEAQRNNK